MSHLTRRFLYTRFGRSVWNWGWVTAQVTETEIAVWYYFWPFHPLVRVPLGNVRRVSPCKYRWYLPLFGVRVEYVDKNGRLTSMTVGSFRPVDVLLGQLKSQQLGAS
jgi:hypothetical protein